MPGYIGNAFYMNGDDSISVLDKDGSPRAGGTGPASPLRSHSKAGFYGGSVWGGGGYSTPLPAVFGSGRHEGDDDGVGPPGQH
jgi:hypothetical protein